MGTEYTRQSTYTDGDTITAAHTNDEFDRLLSVFDATNGHTHDGTSAEGGPITKLLGSGLQFGAGTASSDITITFNTSGNDGELKWLQSDNRFQFSNDIIVVDDKQLIFGTNTDVAVSYDETTTNSLKIAATEGAGLAITLMADEGDDAGDEWKLNIADGGTLTLGNDINSAGTYVTHLTITPNSTVANSTMAVAGNVTVGGNIDVDGTTNLDAVDIDGAVQIDSTITVGANDQGYDVILYGDTASANMTWDTSADDLILNGAAGLVVPDGQLTLGSVALTFKDEDDLSSNSASSIASQQSIKAYVDSQVTAQDLDVTSDSGTIDIDLDSETLTIAGGTGLSSSASSTTVTLAVDAAQTGITSIYATDLILGEDSQTAIDFGTTNEIDFKVDNAARLTLTSSALYPVTNNQIDLGTSSLEFKDAFFDGEVTADLFSGPLTGNVTGTATVATTVTVSDNESTNENNVILFGAGAAGSGNIGVEADGNMTYNPSTGKITATGFIGALTGNADTATVATTVTITDNESTNEDNAIIFTAGGDVDGGNIGLESDGTLTYNPSTGKITATGFIGALTGNVTGNLTGTVSTAAQNTINSATSLAAVGALNAGSITSGFGTIDTGSSAITTTGVITGGTVEVTTDTSAGDNAAIGYTAGEGLILTGQGSTTDVTIKNDADATVASIATGTTVFTMDDDVFVTGRAAGTQTADNDGNFDLTVSNFWTFTPDGDDTITLSNPAIGQSGIIYLDNSGGHNLSAHASIAINADVLSALDTAGKYMLSYYCTATSGDDTILMSATGALT